MTRRYHEFTNNECAIFFVKFMTNEDTIPIGMFERLLAPKRIILLYHFMCFVTIL